MVASVITFQDYRILFYAPDQVVQFTNRLRASLSGKPSLHLVMWSHEIEGLDYKSLSTHTSMQIQESLVSRKHRNETR